MRNISCKDCIHDGVCYLQEVCSDIEEQLEKFGCEDYNQRMSFDNMRLVDANAFLASIEKGTIITDDLYGMGIMAGRDYDKKLIESMPTIKAKPVVYAEWIHTKIEDDDWGGTYHKWTCSNCGFSVPDNPGGANYCQNCGAEMKGVRE